MKYLKPENWKTWISKRCQKFHTQQSMPHKVVYYAFLKTVTLNWVNQLIVERTLQLIRLAPCLVITCQRKGGVCKFITSTPDIVIIVTINFLSFFTFVNLELLFLVKWAVSLLLGKGRTVINRCSVTVQTN